MKLKTKPKSLVLHHVNQTHKNILQIYDSLSSSFHSQSGVKHNFIHFDRNCLKKSSIKFKLKVELKAQLPFMTKDLHNKTVIKGNRLSSGDTFLLSR